MPEMLQRFSEGKRRRTLTKWQWRQFRGAKGAPWKALEDDGKRSIRARNVGILFAEKEIEQRGSESRLKKKTGRNTRSVAAGIAR